MDTQKPAVDDILLISINAKYIHSAFGQRSIFANLGPLQKQTQLIEFDIRRRPSEIVEEILSHPVRILGFGIYIWNVTLVTAVIELIRLLRRDIILILGGPEVSFPDNLPAVAENADYIVCGEGEITFRKLCTQLLNGTRPFEKIIRSTPPDLSTLELPYSLYQEDDIRHRIIYVEASRGCPFGCEFCLSSLEKKVRLFNPQQFLQSLEDLLHRGATQFKFTDRSFNTNIDYACEILQFFLDRFVPGLFLHFETVPWLLPEQLKKLLPQFPAGSLQLEMGIQTLTPEVAERISRTTIPFAHSQYKAAEQNIRWLREHSHVHLHTDLIAGLPGETIQQFAQGFDTLLSWNPQEIQVGILKCLRGAPIARHSIPWKMIYSPQSPYEILQNSTISYSQMCDMKRFARFWDLIPNSGRFLQTAPWIWKETPSPFTSFMECTQWLFRKLGRQSEIALPHLARLLEQFLTEVRKYNPAEIHSLIEKDLTNSSNKQHHHFNHAVRQLRRT